MVSLNSLINNSVHKYLQKCHNPKLMHFMNNLLDWGNLDRGCPDKSDIVKDMAVNVDSDEQLCGTSYSFIDNRSEENKTSSITWFACHKTQKCVHSNSRCDLNPHPACVYVNKDGDLVAEDEESCQEEYIEKNLVPNSAILECIGQVHNRNTSILSESFQGKNSEVVINT